MTSYMHDIVHIAYACELRRLRGIWDEILLRGGECKTLESLRFSKKG